MLLFLSTTVHGTDVQFSFDTTYYKISEGHIRLDWTAKDAGVFELEQATDDSFSNAKTIYSGPDLASFISGLRDGMYHYRVRDKGGAWSDQLTVEVQHQSLKLAFTLFGIGGVVFLLTVLVVVQGARKSSRNLA